MLHHTVAYLLPSVIESKATLILSLKGLLSIAQTQDVQSRFLNVSIPLSDKYTKELATFCIDLSLQHHHSVSTACITVFATSTAYIFVSLNASTL